jgi:hypothetical protein
MHIIYNDIINVYYNTYYICNKGFLDVCDKQQNMAVTMLLLLPPPVSKADCKTFCPMSFIGPVTPRPATQQ